MITGVIDRHRAGVIEDGAVYAEDGRIVAVGTLADLRARYPEAAETGSSRWVLLPGLKGAVRASLLLASCFVFVLLITWIGNRAMVWSEKRAS